MTFSLSGFRTVVRDGVAVVVGATATLDVELPVQLEERVVVVGSRAQPRSVTESSVPIDVIPFQDVISQGATTLDYQLRTLIPSFNVATHPISDAATLVRPATLRNLAHDHTLVLVNGKRRHRSSVVAWFAGVTDGAQGPDISTIPSIALQQVEVLRDGASAQYGSDAIAGVLNFLLKDDRAGGSLEVNTGTYRAGDGDAYTVAGNAGLPLGNTGFANLSFEYGAADPTDRSVQRDDAAALIAAGNTAVANPVQVWGNPLIEDDLKLFANFGNLFANGVQFYGHANYADKKVTEGFYFRNPNTRQNIYSLDSGQTLLIGDVLAAKGMGSANCPTVPITDHVPEQDALAQVLADPNCFSFQEIAPGGFTPQFGGIVTDMSVLGGVRRVAAQRSDLGRQRQLRRSRVGLLLQEHRQRVARPGDSARLRPRTLPAGGHQLQFRRLLCRLGPRQRRGRRRMAQRELHGGRGRAAGLGGRTVRSAGVRPGVERFPRIRGLHGRHLEPQQRRVLRRRGTAGPR